MYSTRLDPVTLVDTCELYCDTSIIIEALEAFFVDGHPSIYPKASDGRSYRSLIRGFASYWTDRPLFRVTTGLIPASVWRTSFGRDRAGLIGHELDPNKLEAKLPQNLSNYDTQCSMFEAQLCENPEDQPWLFSTQTPSLADLSLFYQLEWGNKIAAGRGVENLTGGGTPDTLTDGTRPVFNADRYPRLFKWYHNVEAYLNGLPAMEKQAQRDANVVKILNKEERTSPPRLLPTPNPVHDELSQRTGLSIGATVSVTPDDTGRADPTIGKLLALSPEEVVIQPEHVEGALHVNVHFPRIGFVVRPQIMHKL